MTFREAMQAMLDGKKVRESDWKKGHFIQIDPLNYISDHTNATYFLKTNDYASIKWEIYEEPKGPLEISVWYNPKTGDIKPLFSPASKDGYKYITLREVTENE